MTANCPICRSPVEVDDATLGDDGAKTQCPLCDEVFVVRAPGSGTASAAPPTSGGKTSHTPSGPGSASRRLLEEDAEGVAPRVLVAHDSHAFGDVVRGLLEEEGFDVEVVHDGEAAGKVIADRPPLIAIVEAGLPKKFGFQLCAEFRAMPDPPAVRFLLVASIYDRKRFARQPELADAPDDFVEPRNLELELLPKVRRLLRGRNDSTASRAAVSGTAARRVSETAPPPVSAPAIARPADPPSVSRPTVGEDDFKDLFEDSDASISASPAAAPASSSPPSAPSLSSDDEDDLLRSMLEDSDSFETKAPDSDEEGDARDSSSRDADDGEAEEPSTGGGDSDDELLRTLMRMASNEGVEPSKPTLEDDEVLPESSDEARPPRVEPDEDSLLGGILEDDGVPIPREEPKDEPTGRAPGDEPMELPSVGSVPEVWKSDEEDAKLAADTDSDELEKLLRGDSAAVPARPPPEKPASEPKPVPGAEFREDVVRVSEFEIDDGPAPAARTADPGLDDGDDLLAALESDGMANPPATLAFDRASVASEEGERAGRRNADQARIDRASEEGALGGEDLSPAGVLPGAESVSGTPTVLKGPGGTRGRPSPVTGGIDVEGEPRVAATPSAAADGGSSFSNTESIAGDEDDEKSLAEAKVPMDDELDRLLGGGASNPHEPENAATRPGVGPQPLPADDLAGSGRGQVVAVPSAAGDEHEKAKRLAKLIVGDILLYNADRILDAVKSGTFFEIMKGDIKDGRDFYDEKVSEDVRRQRDYIQEVLEEVLENKRKELGLA